MSSNKEKAYAYFAFHKELQKKFVEAKPQTKVLLSFLIPFIEGFIIYTFLPNTPTNILVFLILSFLSGILLYFSAKNYNEIWVIITSFLIGKLFWIYIFMNQYKKEQSEKDIGKKVFVCNPTGVCKTDGFNGPYDGQTDYTFSDEKYPYIPSNQFDIRISNRFTYMFWLKIDYSKWIHNTEDKIILVKGNNTDSDLSVWALKNDNYITFDIRTNNKPVNLSTNFVFNKWVHYSIVVNNKVVELYKNATLEKTALINGTITLKNSPLYLGTTPDKKHKHFPGQLLFLSYNNSNLLPVEIYDIYKKEYSLISSADLQSPIQPETCPGKDAKVSKDDDSKDDDSKDKYLDYSSKVSKDDDSKDLSDSKDKYLDYSSKVSKDLDDSKDKYLNYSSKVSKDDDSSF